jgi:hypothetical protein
MNEGRRESSLQYGHSFRVEIGEECGAPVASECVAHLD